MDQVIPLIIASTFSVTFPLSTGICTYRRLSREMKLLLLLLAVVMLEQAYTFYLFLNHKTVYWVFHLYTPIEYSLVVLIFSYWQNNRRARTWLRLSIPAFILLSLLFTLTVEKLDQINNVAVSISYVAYIMLACSTLLEIQKSDTGRLLKDCRFWVCASLLLSSCVSLVYFALNDIVFGLVMWGIWTVHALSNIVANVLFGIGFLCKYRQLN